jgi:hypothetical protein
MIDDRAYIGRGAHVIDPQWHGEGPSYVDAS